MKNKIYKIVCICLIWGGNFAVGFTQQNDSLLQYLEIAAKNNPTVLQKYNEYQASLQKIPQVGTLPNPDISLGVFLSPMELVSGNQVADIRLMQMFPWFGVLKNSKDEMSLMAKANYELFRDTKSQVYYDVERTWYNLQKNNQQILILQKNLEILQTLERLSLIKLKTSGSTANVSSSNMSKNNTQNSTTNASGMGTMNGGGTSNQTSNQIQPSFSGSMSSSGGSSNLIDIYKIQIEMSELENNIQLLKNQQKTIVAEFNSYLNRDLDTPISIPKSYKSESLSVPELAILDSISNNNPMIEMLKLEQQSLDAKKKMITGMSYPMIGVGLNYSIINKSSMSTSSMNGKDMIMPMVSVSLPIYQKKYTAMKTETDYLKTAKEEALIATKNSLQLDYYKAIQLYDDSQLRMKLYENQSELTQKTLDIMVKSFSTSGSNLSDVLRTRQQLLDYQFKSIEAITDYNTSIAWLQRLMTISNIQ